VLDDIRRRGHVTTLIEGGATGADSLAHAWAVTNEIPIETYAANWRTHGRSAGPLRNARMLRVGKPDLVVAFQGGSGTANMIQLAETAGIEVRQPRRSSYPS
jgi:hypothetical protein